MKEDFKGIYCVSVTAFKDDESIDEERTKAHLDRVINAGVHGVIIGGSTGEFAYLSEKEREHLLEFGIKYVKGRVPVIAGTMAPSTKETIRWSKFAKDLGADGLMIVNPYYGSITDEALYQHFKAIAESVDLPIMPYNNTDTSGNDLIPEIAIKLAKDLENINYVKECVDTRRVQEIIRGSKGKMNVFMGVDDLTFQGLLLGAKGVVSGGSNIVPEIVVKLYKLIVEDKEIDAARELWYKYLPIANLVETPKIWVANIKAGCELMGDPVGKPRKPVLPASDEMKKRILNILKDLEAI
jgi:4-hydroxy-tetrahydrodipicolinate synthase